MSSRYPLLPDDQKKYFGSSNASRNVPVLRNTNSADNSKLFLGEWPNSMRRSGTLQPHTNSQTTPTQRVQTVDASQDHSSVMERQSHHSQVNKPHSNIPDSRVTSLQQSKESSSFFHGKQESSGAPVEFLDQMSARNSSFGIIANQSNSFHSFSNSKQTTPKSQNLYFQPSQPQQDIAPRKSSHTPSQLFPEARPAEQRPQALRTEEHWRPNHQSSFSAKKSDVRRDPQYTLEPKVDSGSREPYSNYFLPTSNSDMGERTASRPDYEQPPSDVYDRLYENAELSKLEREAKDELNAMERNSRRAPKKDRRRVASRERAGTSTERGEETDQVFDRLYADAQRHNKDVAEREKQIELRRSQPGNVADESSQIEDPQLETADPTPKKKKRVVSFDLFERLSKPTHVRRKFTAEKEDEEIFRKESEQRDNHERQQELESVCQYSWDIFPQSFTFKELENQNSVFAN